MELSRNAEGRVVRHWTMEDAEAADLERRRQADAKIRATTAPRAIGLLAAIALAAVALASRLLPRASRLPTERI